MKATRAVQMSVSNGTTLESRRGVNLKLLNKMFTFEHSASVSVNFTEPDMLGSDFIWFQHCIAWMNCHDNKHSPVFDDPVRFITIEPAFLWKAKRKRQKLTKSTLKCIQTVYVHVITLVTICTIYFAIEDGPYFSVIWSNPKEWPFKFMEANRLWKFLLYEKFFTVTTVSLFQTKNLMMVIVLLFINNINFCNTYWHHSLQSEPNDPVLKGCKTSSMGEPLLPNKTRYEIRSAVQRLKSASK